MPLHSHSTPGLSRPLHRPAVFRVTTTPLHMDHQLWKLWETRLAFSILVCSLACSIWRCIRLLRAGTTLFWITSDAFEAYGNVTGGVLDPVTGLLQITSAQYDNLKSLFFKIGNVNIPTSFYQEVTDVLIYVTSENL
jgi:hypothetical protein